MVKPPFNPAALAWVAERKNHMPVHKVANVDAVQDGARPVMACSWQPPRKGHLVVAGHARNVLQGHFCIKCWRQP